MDFAFETVLEFIASLAVVALLAMAYGAIYRRVTRHHWLADLALGILFGLVAWIEMHRPFEPFAGLVIDIRNIPILLAGAFLGWQGTLACLGIAVATRIGIGGDGLTAGVVAMGMAALLGVIWHKVTRHKARRGLVDVMWLGAAACLTVSAAVILPPAFRSYFFEVVSLPLAMIYMMSVPILAAILEEARLRIEHEDRLKRAATTHDDVGLLTWPAFCRDVKLAGSGRPEMRPAVLLHLKIKDQSWLTMNWGTDVLEQALGIMRLHLDELANTPWLKGRTPQDGLVIALRPHEAHRAPQIAHDLERALAEDGVMINQTERANLRVSGAAIHCATHDGLARALDDIERSAARAKRHAERRLWYRSEEKDAPAHVTHLDKSVQDNLFLTAEVLLASK